MAATTFMPLAVQLGVLLTSPLAVGAVRDSESVGSGSIPTAFASCVCQKDVDGTPYSVILVTKEWDVGKCNFQCPGFCLKEKAPFLRCFQVHTANGQTGGRLDVHYGMRANICPDRTAVEGVLNLDLSIEEPVNDLYLARHETTMAENMFAACSCGLATTGLQFVTGQPTLMGGLQVWGRTGCLKSCQTECGHMGAVSMGCMHTEMTMASKDDACGDLGYPRAPLTSNMQKYAMKHVQKIQDS